MAECMAVKLKAPVPCVNCGRCADEERDRLEMDRVYYGDSVSVDEDQDGEDEN